MDEMIERKKERKKVFSCEMDNNNNNDDYDISSSGIRLNEMNCCGI